MISQHNGGNKGGGDVGGDARNDENDGPRADAGQGEDEAPKATGTNVLWGERAGIAASGSGCRSTFTSAAGPIRSSWRSSTSARAGAFPGRDAPPARRGRGGVRLREQRAGHAAHLRRQRAVLRVGGDGDFVLSVERANAAFHSFLESLAA